MIHEREEEMRKVLFGALIGFVVAGLLSATILIAQERRAEDIAQGPLVVLAGLRLKEDADIEDVERLFKEQLVPGLDGMDGLKLRILKRMGMERLSETTDPGGYDYIMMAEIKSLGFFMQLRQDAETGLSGFGDMMKKHAGSPYFNIYTVIAKTGGTE